MIATLSSQTLRLPLHSGRSEIRDPESLYPAPLENIPYDEKIKFNYFPPSDARANSKLKFVSRFVSPINENTPDEGIFLEIKILHRWINEPSLNPEHQNNIINVLNILNRVILEIQYSFNLNGLIHRQVIESLNRLLEDELEAAHVQYHDVPIILRADIITDAILAYAQHQNHFTPMEGKNKINYFSIINTTASIESLFRYLKAPSPEITQKIKTYSASSLHYYKLNYKSLKSRNLSKAVLNWAYLYNQDLRKIILNGAFLNNSFLSGSNFEEAQCNGASFINTTAHNARFIKASLINADFTGADISGSNFTGAKTKGMILTNAILTGIRSEDESLIECFIENNTLGENRAELLIEVIRYITENSNFDVNDPKKQDILFGMLYFQQERHNENNFLSGIYSLFKAQANKLEHTILSRILTIENFSAQKKCLNLFFDALIRKGLNVSFKQMFCQPNKDLTLFSKYYMAYLVEDRFQFTPDQAREHLTDLNDLNLIRFYLKNYLDARIIFENDNNELSETTLHALDWLEKLNVSVPNQILVLAHFLSPLISNAYYLFDEDVPYLDQGDGKERKIFISKDRRHLFYLSHDYFQNLIHEQDPPVWGISSERLYFVFDDSSEMANQGLEYRHPFLYEESSDAEVFSHVPFLNERYAARRRGNIGKFLQLLNLKDYTPAFIEAVSRKIYRFPLVSSEDQGRLGSIFSIYMQGSRREAIVRPNFINILNSNFHYNELNNEKKSELLSVLCFIFARLSCDAFFGVSAETPLILREFSAALLNTAVQLNPNLQVEYKEFNNSYNWKDCLLGDVCTELLSRRCMYPVVKNYSVYSSLSSWEF